MQHEKRHFHRIEFDAKASLISDKDTYETTLIDISLHGALTEKPSNLSANSGDPYKLQLKLTGSNVKISMNVKVAHVEGNAIGFECENIDIDSITHLRKLVELNLGDTTLLDRELSELVHLKD